MENLNIHIIKKSEYYSVTLQILASEVSLQR